MNQESNETLIILATYNEMENLPQLIDSIFATVSSVDLLVVDDNSPDGTGRWATEESKRNPQLFCLIREKKDGLGNAIIAGLKFALAKNYRYIVNLDADFSHPVDKIPLLLQTIQNATNPMLDVVIGSRYVPGGGIQGWPFTRKIMSRGINLYSQLLLGLATKDNSGSFRCYRSETLKRLDFSSIKSKGYSFFEELLFRLQQKDASFAEIPIVFVDRVRGVSKINKKEAIKALWLILTLGISRLFR
ncbi:MAG: polyprenol monophosphomannose synthase [Planctomycetia bacterium]|nr:polyprenol monophosphomannose synthase [Planctomycetia bacterium]